VRLNFDNVVFSTNPKGNVIFGFLIIFYRQMLVVNILIVRGGGKNVSSIGSIFKPSSYFRFIFIIILFYS
jgi:hypothetical protein